MSDNDIKEGLTRGFSRILSFLITAAIGGFLGLSITKQTIAAALFAIAGGFIGDLIFKAWWRGMKSSSVARGFKAFIFTLFTIAIMVGIALVALGRV